MTTLSTGQPSTLGNYRDMAAAFFGESSRPVAFLDDKIAESAGGRDEEVTAPESQMIFLLVTMARDEAPTGAA